MMLTFSLSILPVATLISEDVQENTLEQFLVATKKKIEARAKEIVSA
jgi:hypothetical protein